MSRPIAAIGAAALGSTKIPSRVARTHASRISSSETATAALPWRRIHVSE
jgi:hypothetical protein